MISLLPACLYNRLQSVLKAAARSIAGLRRSDHITDTLASFHWLKAPKRVQYKLATIVYRLKSFLFRCDMAPHYLSIWLQTYDVCPTCLLDDVCGHHLPISSMSAMQSQCATVEDRTFAVAGARLWNSLPPDIVACDTLPQFRRELKTFLFRQSYSSILI